MVKNIVFDMGGVLIHFTPDVWLAPYPEEDRTILRSAIFGSADWLRLDRGEITEEELIGRATAEVPERLREDAVRLVRWYDPLEPMDGMESLIRELHAAGYAIRLLSNTSKSFHQFREQIPALRYFSGEFISADVGILKPDSRIYALFLAQFGLNPEECLFIDDNPENVNAAIAAGMQGLVFNGAADLREKLGETGILPG